MSKARTPIQRLRAAGRVEIDEPDEVMGYWKHWRIWVHLDSNGDWYIRVTDPRGCYAYDGWWHDSYHKTAEAAVSEAFRGACLLEQSTAA